MYRLVNVHEFSRGVQTAVDYFYSKWGSPDNYPFYLDAISHSSTTGDTIPQFYLMLNDDEIVGCYGLITNDAISRHDLSPWLCSLYIEPEHRGKRLSDTIFQHAKQIVKSIGLPALYLVTDHNGLYEKFGWERLEDGYGMDGKRTRIYRTHV